MAQATGVQSFFDAYVEVKPSNTFWTDISGWGSSIAVSGGDRQTGAAYTYDGDTAVMGRAKREPRTITVRFLYTEGASDTFKIVWDAYRAGTVMQVRYSPFGGDTNESRFTTNSTYSFIKNCMPPAGEAGSGDPIMCEFVVETSDITEDKEAT